MIELGIGVRLGRGLGGGDQATKAAAETGFGCCGHLI
jgi:hypothetical protein